MPFPIFKSDKKYTNSFTDECKRIYPILSIVEEFDKYDITENSTFNEIKDTWDSIYLIIECEKIYDFVLYDCEAERFGDLRIIDIHDLIIFLKGESECTETVLIWINININEISKRPFYKSYLRDLRINIII